MTTSVRKQRVWLLLLLIAPIVLTTLAYLWLAVAHGTPWLWNVVVHEGGHYTFGQTVLFVRHHVREIPVDVAMALALAAAIHIAIPDEVPVSRRWFAAIALLMVALSLTVAAAEEGWREALRDLLQFRTRDDDTRYGSHWRFHLLSTIWFCGAAPLLAGVSIGLPGLPRVAGRSRALLMAAWGWVALLTLAFGVGPEPFTSARYIGHQAREILTHGLITLPLVFAICVLAGRATPARDAPRARMAAQILTWLVVAGIPVFLVAAFRGTGLDESAQLQSGLSGVVAAHVFEHLLDYMFVTAVTLAIVGRNHGTRR